MVATMVTPKHLFSFHYGNGNDDLCRQWTKEADMRSAQGQLPKHTP